MASLSFNLQAAFSAVRGRTDALMPEPLTSHARGFLVLVEVALEGKRLPTATADVRFFRGVGLDVCSQVGLVREGFPALWTPERLLSSVGSDVTLKQPRSAEFLPAVWTFTSLVVGADVHAVCGHGDIHFFAVWTFPGFLVTDTSVSLTMARQITGSAVSFSAVYACVRVNAGFPVGGEKKFAEG